MLMLQEAEDSFYLIRKQVKDRMYAMDREVIVMDTGETLKTLDATLGILGNH